MLRPCTPWVGARLQALALESLAVFGERHPATAVICEARAMKPFVRPPKLSLVEACVRLGPWRTHVSTSESFGGRTNGFIARASQITAVAG